MSTTQNARIRARGEVTAAIKDEARRQLAAEGAARLSLRAVARELGMVSSALYRYFPSRDALLTALIADAHDSLGEAAEAAQDAVAGEAPLRRWTAVCEAVRGWGLARPHEYALVHGSPVPGYTAPRSTAPAAARAPLVLIGVVRDAHRQGALVSPPLPAGLRAGGGRLAAGLAPDLPPETVVALVAAWAQLCGLVGFELSGQFGQFGQFQQVAEDRAPFFRHAVTGLAAGVGLLRESGRPAGTRALGGAGAQAGSPARRPT
ncbi:TetR/AcrR family transcriptional regulator [Streptomyces sp. NPDC047000]|uniref:TetR/AcrR family transcriptional regulator n=1 Tax=Streptomyces sp. NPDC047000 TaxID=3155474 RepID=UPI003405599A